jgi:cytidylate kinase
MPPNIGSDQYRTFIVGQLSPAARAVEQAAKPSITISRLTGAGGHTVAGKLAEYLQANSPAHAPWTVFDRNLMEKVLEDHHLSKELAKFEHERHKPFIHDALEEILGLHPSSWTIVQHTAETIWKLTRLGNVILVGLGANLVTASLKHVFHVRLVASQERCVQRVQELQHLDSKAALAYVKEQDTGRRRYVKDHFHKDDDDPLLYDLVINTDRITYDDAARLIGDTVMHRFKLARPPVPALA